MTRRLSPKQKVLRYGSVAAVILLFLMTVPALWWSISKIAGRISGDFFYPYISIAGKAKAELSDATMNLVSKRELAAEVLQLRADNLMMAGRLFQLEELEKENETLRRMNRLSKSWRNELVAAQVIMRNPYSWNYSFTIDAGSDRGVGENMAVLALDSDGNAVLFGIVAHSGKHTSLVESVFSSKTRLSAYLPASAAVGFINDGTASLEAERSDLIGVGRLPGGKKYEIGTKAYTSGFEEAIPPGIFIGSVVAADDGENIFSAELYRSALLQSPLAGLNPSLVMVVIPRTNGN